MLKPGAYIVNIRHDDNCRFWQNDNFDDCNCNPEIEQVEITDGNHEKLAADWVDGERRAQVLRGLARKRN